MVLNRVNGNALLRLEDAKICPVIARLAIQEV